jgi:biopolymer transport protein ExbB
MANVIDLFRAGGFIMWPLLALSLVCGAIIIERLLAFREMGNLAPGLLARVLALCSEGRADEAQRECEKTPGPVAACLGEVLKRRGQKAEVVERWVEQVGQEYFLRLERGLSILDTTTTISPLLGLLGTILGMIGAFNAISAGSRRGNADSVLAGVGEALYATAAGIVVAVVCFVAYNAFATRLRAVQAETEMAVTKLMNVLGEAPPQTAPPTQAAQAS